MPRCYMVKKGIQLHDGPPPCSPTEGSVAPPCYVPAEDTAVTDPSPADLIPPEEQDLVIDADAEDAAARFLLERTEADTEAAHDLLSLANSHYVPPPQEPPTPPPESSPASQLQQVHQAAPAAVLQPAAPSSQQTIPLLTMLPPPETPMVPVYTYTIQPANIFIITEDPPEPIYQVPTYLPTVAPVPQYEYMVDPQLGYLAYQPMAEPQYQFVESMNLPIIENLQTLNPVIEPSVIEPTLIESPVVEPAVTESPILEPAVIEAPVLEPAVIEAPVPEPAVIESPVIEPSVIKPPEISRPIYEILDDEILDDEILDDENPLQIDDDVIELDSDSEEENTPLPPKDKLPKFDCDECGKSYATSSNLSRHKQTHRSLDSDEAKRCEDCGKAYVSMPALAMHVLTHRMGHVCRVCGKQFSRPWLLRGHLRSHTGEKPYNCPLSGCTKAFGDRSNLRAHLQTHNSQKNYQCCRCLKSFALKSYLSKHLETTCLVFLNE